MRRFSAWAVGLVAAAVAIGCGPGKEIPDEVQGPKPFSGPAPDPLGPAPSASDPAAKAVLERAVKAITENVPGGLEKAKVSRTVYKGEMQLPQRSEMTKIERTVEAVWPDQALVVNAFKDDRLEVANATATFYLRGKLGWNRKGLELDEVTQPAELGQIIRADLVAQYWLLLGLPLAQSEVVAFDLKKAESSKTVKVGLPGMPVLRVTFEEKTGLPVQVEYHPVELQHRPHKIFKMSEHKPAGGLMLPTKVELTQNGRAAEQFTLSSWEFPPTIDPTHFEPPKR